MTHREEISACELRQKKFDDIAAADSANECQNYGFHNTNTEVLECEEQKYIESRDDDGGHQVDAEEKIQTDGGAKHLGQIARGDGDFAEKPQGDCDGLGV